MLRLKPICDEPLSNFACNVNLRRYSTVAFHVLHVVFSALNLDVNFVQPQCVVGW